jgi:hypothetical protein
MRCISFLLVGFHEDESGREYQIVVCKSLRSTRPDERGYHYFAAGLAFPVTATIHLWSQRLVGGERFRQLYSIIAVVMAGKRVGRFDDLAALASRPHQ